MINDRPRDNNSQLRKQQQDKKEYKNAVFVSYAWGGDSERYVDALEKTFAERGISIVRDKKNLSYRGSIEAFEQRIGRGECVVLVISDKYLRSEHCMYEMVKVNENQNLRERIFPVVLADASIYKPTDRLNYIKYWDNQIEKLNQAIKGINVMTNLDGIMANLKKYNQIRSSFDHLIELLCDMNALTPEIHMNNGFSILINAIEQSIDRKPTSAFINQHKRNVAFNDSKTWEEFATFLPKTASDTNKLMFAVCYHIETENNEVVEIGAITKDYFRRARWASPVNLSATANYCAGKGWLSECGRKKTKKLWKITKRGYETVQAKIHPI